MLKHVFEPIGINKLEVPNPIVCMAGRAVANIT